MSWTSRLLGPPGRLTGLLDRLGVLLLVVSIGVIAGLQYLTPNKRTLSVLTAILMFGLTWRLDLASGLGIMAIALPFPRTTSFGNTNVFFIVLMLVTWLLRVTMRQSTPPRRSPIDVPLVMLFVSYVVSFYNIEAVDLVFGLGRFQMMVATWLMFYLVASVPESRREFQRLLGFQAFSVLLVCLLGIFEMTNPGKTLIPGWIEFGNLSSPGAAAFGIRVGSAFFDYELLCEYCAIQSFLILYLFLRADSILLRTAYGGLLALVVFVLFTTVTRGGIIALGIGLLYLVWLVRRRLSAISAMTMAGALAAGMIFMNWFVATYTRTGNMFERLSASSVSGFIPDNRAEVWPAAWNRIFEHPFLGHGPYYSILGGARLYWFPHSLYLYVANNVGFIGLAIFAWLLWTMFRITRPTTDDLRHADSLQSFMLIARAQMVVFLVDEVKIEYLRNEVYAFQVWMMFALMVAAHRLLSSGPAYATPAPRGLGRPVGPLPSRCIPPQGLPSPRG
jgi:O-antigen ligase